MGKVRVLRGNQMALSLLKSEGNHKEAELLSRWLQEKPSPRQLELLKSPATLKLYGGSRRLPILSGAAPAAHTCKSVCLPRESLTAS